MESLHFCRLEAGLLVRKRLGKGPGSAKGLFRELRELDSLPELAMEEVSWTYFADRDNTSQFYLEKKEKFLQLPRYFKPSLLRVLSARNEERTKWLKLIATRKQAGKDT